MTQNENLGRRRRFMKPTVHFSLPYLWSLVICCLAGLTIRAQEVRFSAVEGSEQVNEEQIRNICQLPDGRIVVVTEGMLNLFDGAGFKNIHIDDGSMANLPAYDGFHHIYLEHNRLWLKNKGKLVLINMLQEKCEADPAKVLAAMGFPQPAADLFIDNNKDIWVVGTNGLIYHRDQSGMIKLLPEKAMLPDGSIDKLYDLVSLDDRTFLFYKSGLLRCIQPKTGTAYFQKNLLASDGSKFNQTLYVIPVGSYIYQLRNGAGGLLTRYDVTTGLNQVILEVPYWLNSLAADRSGNFWMSCSVGLWYFQAGQTKGVFYPAMHMADGKSIKTEVSYVFFDLQNGLWAGTYNKGLFYYHPGRFKFKTFSESFLALPELANVTVTCFTENEQGDLFIGTNRGLYTTPVSLENKTAAQPLLANVHCNALLATSEGIWIACQKGLYSIKKNSRLKLEVSGDACSIFETPDKSLYVSLNGTLLKYERSTRQFIDPCKSRAPKGVQSITSWGNKLLGISAEGIFIFNPADGIVSFPLASAKEVPAMFRYNNHSYTCLLQDSRGMVWMGTYDGLNMWDEKSKKLYQLHTADGLVNNSIKGIIEANDGSMWVTMARGISRLYPQTSNTGYDFKFVNFNYLDGVLSHAFAERSIFITANDQLFAGGLDGFNVYQSEKVAQYQQVLNVLLVNVKLSGNPVEAGVAYDGSVILKKTLALSDTLLLEHDQNFFSIRFSGLNYRNPTQTYYRYMLVGVDNEWRTIHQPSATGEAFYTNVPPGTYQFKVQATANLLHWPTAYKSLQVIINPPFWKTLAAKLLYLFLGTGVIIGFAAYWVRRSRIVQQERQQAAIEAAKSDFITNMSHELRTPLSLIISPLQSLQSKVDEPYIKNELGKINGYAGMLLDTVNQLLEYKRVDADREVLHLTYCNDFSFLQELCQHYGKLAQAKQVAFYYQLPAIETSIWVDRQKLTRILHNLLTNALKFTASGEIHAGIALDETTKSLSISVEDTGIGIAEKEIDQVFDRFYQATNQNDQSGGSGIGLFMVKQYAVMHGGGANITSKQGTGTTVLVTLMVAEPISQTIIEPGIKTGKSILLVEDHPAFRDYLAAELGKSYTVTTAANGIEALQRAAETAPAPDLIISDIMMPEMNGQEFCKALRLNLSISHIPVIMLTAQASGNAEFNAYDCGADAYMSKPVDMALLRLRIEKILDMVAHRQKIFDNQQQVKVEEITSNPLEKEMLDRAIRLVEANLADTSYSVEKFSADMHMDRTGLYRKLLALTGHSPTNFIRALRMKKSVELLMTRRLSVAEVAEQVGFGSLSYFSRCFHEAFGKTPTQYVADAVAKSKKL